MQCPNCPSEVLVALEFEQVEVDYCVRCQGIWLDTGELELLFGDPTAVAEFLTIGSPAAPKAGERSRKCPECRVTMTKESTESNPPVIFDHCPNGDGLWFDQGELATILQHGEALPAGVPLPEFLRNIFSKTE